MRARDAGRTSHCSVHCRISEMKESRAYNPSGNLDPANPWSHLPSSLCGMSCSALASLLLRFLDTVCVTTRWITACSLPGRISLA